MRLWQQVLSFRLEDLLNMHVEPHFQQACFCVSIMQNVINPKSFSSIPKGFGRFGSAVKTKQRRWTVLPKNAKQPLCLNTSLKTLLSQMHSLGLNKTFFFSCIWHCRPSAAWLGLAWCICLWERVLKKNTKKNTCISLSQLNCSEVLPSRTRQMWGLDLQ